MATPAELDEFAQWLETNGYAHRERRAVTRSYLDLIFGPATPCSLQAVRDYLSRRGKALERQSWLTVRRQAGE